MFLLCLINILPILSKKKKQCDFYCVSSSRIPCRRVKRVPDDSFCSSYDSCSSSTSCRRPRRRSDDSTTTRVEYKDAVLAVEEILACMAFDAKFLLAQKRSDLISKINDAFTTFNTQTTTGITNVFTNLITTINTLEGTDVPVEVANAVTQANTAFALAVEDATIKNMKKADWYIHHLAKETDNAKVAANVRDFRHGLQHYIDCDFADIVKTYNKEFPVIAQQEFTAINAALAVESADVVAAVETAQTDVLAVLSTNVTQLQTTIANIVAGSYKELELSLDLLFCENGHFIVDIVKQIGSGKKVVVPRKTRCEPTPMGQLMRTVGTDLVLEVA